MKRLYCSLCRDPKPHYLFAPAQVRKIREGKAGYCMSCTKAYRQQKKPGGPKGYGFRNDPVIFPGSQQRREM